MWHVAGFWLRQWRSFYALVLANLPKSLPGWGVGMVPGSRDIAWPTAPCSIPLVALRHREYCPWVGRLECEICEAACLSSSPSPTEAPIGRDESST
jgi:hypothetical protein